MAVPMRKARRSDGSDGFRAIWCILKYNLFQIAHAESTRQICFSRRQALRHPGKGGVLWTGGDLPVELHEPLLRLHVDMLEVFRHQGPCRARLSSGLGSGKGLFAVGVYGPAAFFVEAGYFEIFGAGLYQLSLSVWWSCVREKAVRVSGLCFLAGAVGIAELDHDQVCDASAFRDAVSFFLVGRGLLFPSLFGDEEAPLSGGGICRLGACLLITRSVGLALVAALVAGLLWEASGGS